MMGPQLGPPLTRVDKTQGTLVGVEDPLTVMGVSYQTQRDRGLTKAMKQFEVVPILILVIFLIWLFDFGTRFSLGFRLV